MNVSYVETTFYTDPNDGDKRSLRVTFSNYVVNKDNNYSTFNYKIHGGGNSAYWYQSKNCKVLINGTEVYNSGDTVVKLQKDIILKTGTMTVYHDDDGSKVMPVSLEAGIFYYNTIQYGSANVTLTPIDRMPKITSITGANNYFSRNTIVINTNLPAKRFQLMDLNDNVLVDTGTVTATSSYTLYHFPLDSNTLYRYKARALNDVGWGEIHGVLGIVTGNTPQVLTDNATFTDDGTYEIRHTVPDSSANSDNNYWRNFTLKIDKTTIKTITNVKTSPYILSFTEDEKQLIRNSIIGGDSIGCTLSSTVVSYNNTYISNTTEHTIKLSGANPEVSSNDISYKDINADIVAITGSNKKIINNLSNVEVTLNSSTPEKGATISTVVFTIGSDQISVPANSNGGATAIFENANGTSIGVTVTDSRGLTSTIVTKDYELLIDYTIPTLETVNILRTNDGVGTNLNIKLGGKYTLFTGLQVSNSIKKAYYKYKKVEEANYSELILMSGITQLDGNYNIDFTTLSTLPFDIFSEYNIQIVIEDVLSQHLYSIDYIIPTAEILMAINKNINSVGIGGLPDVDKPNSLQVMNDLYIGGNKIPDPYPVGSIYLTINSTNPSIYFGGTWQLYNPGRTLVCIDTSQGEFNTVNKTGGAKTHTLISTEMPSHTHGQNSHTHSQNPHRHTHTGYWAVTTQSGGRQVMAVDILSGDPVKNSSLNNTTATNNYSTAVNHNTGGSQPHNNLQPYVVCYMWLRTA